MTKAADHLPMLLLSWLIMAIRFHNEASSISVATSQRVVYAAEATDLQLRCSFSSEPEYVMWHFSSYDASSDKANMMRCFYQLNRCILGEGFTDWTNAAGSANGTLTLARITRQQDGFYECEGTSDFHTAQAGMRVYVTAIGTVPSISQSPSLPSAGDLVTLTCVTNGWNPSVTIAWTKAPIGTAAPVNLTVGTFSIVDSPPAEKFGATSSSLTMTVGPADDETAFICSAMQQETGQISIGRINMRVEYKPIIGSVPNIVAIEGTPISITCQANGYPRPRLLLITANGSILQEFPVSSGSGSGSSTAVAVFTLAPDRGQAASYSCRAVNSLGAASTTFSLAVLYPPTVQAPSSVTVRETDPALLPCRVSGNPQPTGVQWRHIVTGEVRLSGANGTDLVLTATKRQQSGEWRCEVRAILTATAGASLEFSASASLILTVQYAPEAPTVMQTAGPALSGTRVNFTCLPSPNAPGEPPPSLRWSRAPVVGGDDDGGGDRAPPSSYMAIDRVSLDNSGMYYCWAANSLGTSRSIPVSLEVVQAPRVIFPSTAEPIRARSGDGNFSLACVVTANPRPLIRWRRLGAGADGGVDSPLTNSSPMYSVQYEISAESYHYRSTLYFRGSQRASVQLNDTGSYLCEAINDLGALQVKFQLVVEVNPKIKNQLNKVALTSDRKLSCQFISHRPVTVTWTGPDGQPRLGNASDDALPWQLTSLATGPLSLGNYTCTVNNSLGRDFRLIRLLPPSLPDPPLLAIVEATGWDRIKLVWTPGFDGGMPTRLRVDASGWNASVGRSTVVSMVTDPSLGYLEIKQLFPDTLYTVNVTPVNQLGEGPVYSGGGGGSGGRGPALVATTGHLRLPQPSGARWDPASGILTFSAASGSSAGDSGLCALLQASRDGGETWATVGECRACDPAGGDNRLGLGDLGSLYRVFLCLANRTDVCGVPYTTYTVASLGSVSLIAIIAVSSVCCVIVATLAMSLLCLCIRRRSPGRAGKSGQLASESQAVAAGAAAATAAASGSLTATASIRRSCQLLPTYRQQPTSVAFVSPALTERLSNQTQDTCLDGSSYSCANGSSASPLQSGGSSALGVATSLHHLHHQLEAVYSSDITDDSGNCYKAFTPPSHRKVIYEVVV